MSSDQVGAVAAVDLNGDGITDVVGTMGLGELSVRLGRGGGVMDSSTTYRMYLGFTDPSTGLVIADFNGDGLPDALVSRAIGVYWLLLGTPGGAFNSPVYPISLAYPGGRSVYAGDFNRDGRMDFAAGATDRSIRTPLWGRKSRGSPTSMATAISTSFCSTRRRSNSSAGVEMEPS